MQVPGRQKQLRQACQLGDTNQVKRLLEGKHASHSARTAFAWLLRCSGKGQGERAQLDFIYEDDGGNMSIHYICLGPPSSLLERTLNSFQGTQQAKSKHDEERAELLRWLLTSGHIVPLGAVNLKLESPLHCALHSASSEVIQVLVEAVKKDCLQSRMLHDPDVQDVRPLDLAMRYQQWSALSLLVGAGALQSYPPFIAARNQLEMVIPATQLPGMGRYGSFAPLPFGLGRILSKPASMSASAMRAASDGSAADAPGGHLLVLESTEAILQQREQLARSLSTRLRISKASAALLLANNRWQEQAAAKAHSDQGSDQDADTDRQPTEAPGCLELPACCICFERFDQMRSCGPLSCSHAVCDDCWKGTLKAKLNSGDAHQICCPHNCPGTALPTSAAQQLLSPSEFSRFQSLLAQQFVDVCPDLKWCPRPGCGRCILIVSEAGASDGLLEAARAAGAVDAACSCGQDFCFSCLAAPHEPCSCNAVQQWAKVIKEVRAEEAARDDTWVERNSKPCKGCGARIQKTGGCNHLVCSKCKHQFCWVCGDDWSKHSADTGGHYLCNRYAAPATDAQGEVGILPWTVLASLLGRLKEAANGYRLSYFVRRYRACECNAHQIRACAAWMAALLKQTLPSSIQPAPSAGGEQGPAALSHLSRLPLQPRTEPLGLKSLAVLDEQPLRPGCGDLFGSMDSFGSKSSSEQAYHSAKSEVPSHGQDAHSGSCTDHMRAPVNEGLEFLAQSAAAVIHARRILQWSYVAAYYSEWGADKRAFEELQGQLEEATEMLMTLLVHLPHAHLASQMAEYGDGWLRLIQVAAQPWSEFFGGTPIRLDRPMLKEQLCFALAVHERRQQMATLLAAVTAACHALQCSKRRGSFSAASGAAEEKAPQHGSASTAPSQSVGGLLQNLGFAALHFLEQSKGS